MGECGEMVLDGYLDLDGSYSGNTQQYGKSKRYTENYNKVFSLFRSWSIKPDRRWLLIGAWGQHLIKERGLTKEQKINFLGEAATNWKEFKKFISDNKNLNISTI